MMLLHEFTIRDPEEVIAEQIKRDYIDGIEPVTPEEFLDNPYYLGEWGKSLYPIWKRDLCYVLDPKKRIEEWALVGAQGTGKSTAVLAAQCYKVYRFSRLQNPLKFFELDAVSKVYFGIFSLNKEKSSGLYDKFSAVLNQSPYFQQRFPSRRKRMFNQYGKVAKDETDLAAMVELVLPSNLRVIGGSMTQHAVSVDLMSCILDEMNWRRKKTIRPEEDANSALSLYEQVRTRITGRFVSKHQTAPGILCAISSKRATTDFMDGLTARIKKEPSRGFVSDYALWEAKPGRTFSGEKFYVFIGGSYGQSRIIPTEELEKYDLNSMSVLPIPEEFRPEFQMNITTALRDIAGVSTVPYQLLFEQEAQIRQVEDPSRKSPFFSDEIELGVNTETTLDRALDIDRLTIFDGMIRKPIMYPNSPRYIHIDLSKNKDATGITMLCPSDVRRVSSRTPDGKLAEALIPLVYVDFMIRIRAAHGDQIDYDKIRQFLVFLRRIGFRVACVSYDSFQSTDSMQMLSKMGFKTSAISTVRSDLPYLSLKQAFVQRRLNLYHYMPVVVELRQLIHNQEDGEVDHPDVDANGGPGSKDIADSLCGAYWSLTQAISAVKTSTKNPTTLDPSRYEISQGKVGDRVAAFFEGLKGAETPDSFVANDYLVKEKITALNLNQKS